MPFINIENNAFDGADENVISETVHIVLVESERPILAPGSNITIRNNNIIAGAIPFEFKVTSISNENGIFISSYNYTKKATKIIYEDMVTVAVVADVQGRTGEYFIWRLVDEDDKPIANAPMQIGFNGVVYDNVTDENGYAGLQINLGYKGVYTFAICFLGDDCYNASFVIAKVTVNQQSPKLTASNKTYKSTNKNKVLTAKLTDAKGNLIKGKTIKFKVNGKTYSAKTDAKGVASVKVSLSAKKTYKYTVSFSGNSAYKATSSSGKLVIN